MARYEAQHTKENYRPILELQPGLKYPKRLCLQSWLWHARTRWDNGGKGQWDQQSCCVWSWCQEPFTVHGLPAETLQEQIASLRLLKHHILNVMKENLPLTPKGKLSPGDPLALALLPFLPHHVPTAAHESTVAVPIMRRSIGHLSIKVHNMTTFTVTDFYNKNTHSESKF